VNIRFYRLLLFAGFFTTTGRSRDVGKKIVVGGLLEGWGKGSSEPQGFGVYIQPFECFFSSFWAFEFCFSGLFPILFSFFFGFSFGQMFASCPAKIFSILWAFAL